MIYAVYWYLRFSDGSYSACSREGSFIEGKSPQEACRKLSMDPDDCQVEIPSAKEPREIVWTGERFKERSKCST